MKKTEFKFDIQKQEKKIFIIFLCAILLYSGFVFFGDVKKITAASLSFNWYILPGIVLLTLLNYFFRFLRFRYLLKKIDIEIAAPRLFAIFMSGIAMTVTPGKMGEVLKAYLIRKERKSEFSQLIPLLIFERVFDGIAMIIMAIGGVFFFRESLLFFIFSTAMVIGFFVFIGLRKHVISLARMFEKRFFRIKILTFLISFFEHSQKLITFQNVFVSTILGIIAWSFEGISLFWLVYQFNHLATFKSLFLSFFIFSFSSIAGFLVLIPGGVGVAEGSISSLLVLFFGLSLPQSIFITLLFRFLTLWLGVSIGLIFLLRLLKNKK
jgi:uncharacterized protein (TIRG00374 family)